MRDYVQEIKKQKIRKNTVIIVASFAFAFMVNGFLFWTSVWNKLQADIKWATTTKTDKFINSDLYLQSQWTWSDSISLKLWTSIKQVSEIRVSLITNPDESAFKINNIINDEDKNVEIIKISNTPWIYALIFKFKKPVDLSSQYTLANIMYTKTTKDKVSINIATTNFISNKETFELTSSSIEF